MSLARNEWRDDGREWRNSLDTEMLIHEHETFASTARELQELWITIQLWRDIQPQTEKLSEEN